MLAALLTVGLTGCSSKPIDDKKEAPVIAEFSAEYEVVGKASTGQPKNDTYIFKGKTTDGVITELYFDIIRNKDTDGAFSKKDIMGYLMNVSDGEVVKTDNGFKLVKLSSNGYDGAYNEGAGAQFMVTASIDELTEETTFKDLFVSNFDGSEVTPENAIIAFSYVAKEAGIENFSADTLVKDLLVPHGLYADGSFVEGSKRVSYAGYNGGRSYGEQIDAISTHILAHNMTLEEVYEMFKNVNKMEVAILDRDTISGATIAFPADFQRVVYLAINGVLFEGVTNHTVADGNTTVEVVTLGYGGEIITLVTFDAQGKITNITVNDTTETSTHGALLTVEGSDFIATLLANQDDLSKVDAVTNVTITSDALVKAVQFAIDFYKGL